MLHDSGVYCWFNAFEDEAFELIWDFLEAVTGWKITREEWYSTMARRILQIQRSSILLGGPDIRWDPNVHDDNPPRWYEALTKGPYAGKASDREELEKARKKYYVAVGWDEKGIPSSEELKRLGLEDVAKKLSKTLRA